MTKSRGPMPQYTRKKISRKYCPRFGQTAVAMGFITAERLKEALNIQVDDDISGNEHRLIGAILFENDWMCGEQIEAVLNLMLKQMRTEQELGEQDRVTSLCDYVPD